jgi:peptide/nickel transport system permease protein
MPLNPAANATGTDFTPGIPSALKADAEAGTAGIGPYALAWRRLRRNYVALAFGALFC